MEKQPLKYIPGVCNIGPDEIQKRMFAGWLFLVITILLNVGLYYLHVAPIVRIVVFFPAWISALGFHFCVAFGTQGLFNVSSEAGKTESVSQQEFRKKDQQTATKIIIYSVIIGLVVAILTVLL
jgi:hypothetical protein